MTSKFGVQASKTYLLLYVPSFISLLPTFPDCLGPAVQFIRKTAPVTGLFFCVDAAQAVAVTMRPVCVGCGWCLQDFTGGPDVCLFSPTRLWTLS